MYREISDPCLFVETSPYGLGLYKQDLGPIFLCTNLALTRSVNKKLLTIWSFSSVVQSLPLASLLEFNWIAVKAIFLKPANAPEFWDNEETAI